MKSVELSKKDIAEYNPVLLSTDHSNHNYNFINTILS